MRTFAQRRRDVPTRPCRAFTLVELVTAASLMTIMMIGVVQVFGVVTQTAAQAEGLSFAQQQARVIFDNLNRDLRGMTREGYLSITHNTITSSDAKSFVRSATPWLPTDSAISPTGDLQVEAAYFCDTLAFVTIGRFSTTWKFEKSLPGGAAEVVYTNYVQTPDSVLQATCASSTSPMNPRKGLLARGLWLWFNDQSGSVGYEEQDGYDKPEWDSLSEMFAKQSGGRAPNVTANGKGKPWVTVWPWKPDDSSPTTNLPSLRHVLASCVSEFYVEIFNPDGDDGYPFDDSPLKSSLKDARNWRMGPVGQPNSTFTETYRWAPPPPDLTKTRPLSTWPRAIRVTVAIHDPSDSKPLKPGKRAEGYAFQETFWLGDP
jgi:type II secretory pathway pseudopilin PulG